MACCGKGNKLPDYNIDNESKNQAIEMLPSFIQKKGEQIARHIALYFLEGFADIIFKNGIIYTMNEQYPVAEAVAVRKQTIIAVGTLEQVMGFFDETKTKIVDLQGRTMLPGFIDPHMHTFPALLDKMNHLSPFYHKNMAEVQHKIIETVKNWKSDELLFFYHFDPLITPGTLDVSVQALDAYSSTVPICILETNGHVAHVNSAAYKIAGITNETPDPPHSKFVRDSNGKLTGEVQEVEAVSYFAKKIPKILAKDYEEGMIKLFEMAASKGCTSLHDCAIGAADPKLDFAILHKVIDENCPIRFSGLLVSHHWDYWIKQKIIPNKSDTFRINGMKAWADGSTQGGSAFERQGYLIQAWKNGSPNYSQEQLNEVVLKSQQLNWQVGIHANGDAAIDMALNAYENAEKLCPKENLRHRIQHTTICSRQQFERMKKLNVSPSFLIGHVYYYGKAFQDKILGKQRAMLTDSVRTALECGLKATLHSDYNCQPIGPLRCIYNAVTRIMRNTENEVLNKNQSITPLQAVRAVTIDAAWQCHLDDIVGSIQKQKLADFVILDRDPLKVEPQQIINIQICETWMNGQLRYKNLFQKQQ